jgi:hypothetical protein
MTTTAWCSRTPPGTRFASPPGNSADRRRRVRLLRRGPAPLVPSTMTIPSAAMPAVASTQSTWLTSRPSAAWRRAGTGRWWRDRALAAGDHPVARIPGRAAVRSPAGPPAMAEPIF